jgi:ABC-type Mn2+/Zn2+ transport system ATPase subunit
MITLKTNITPDQFTDKCSEAFDYEFIGESVFELPDFTCPKEFQLGIIVGSSGSGKSQILKHYFNFVEPKIEWDREKAIISHFSSPEEAFEKMFAVGIASIPTLCKPFHVLSNGEQFRALISRQLKDWAIIDEFTSVVNRETALSLSVCLSKYIRKNNLKNIVLASCHRDIVDWLEPDWVFDTDSKQYSKNELDCKTAKKVAKIEILTTHD